MAEQFKIIEESKDEKYANLYPQIVSVLSAETDFIANMANMAAMIKETFQFWWVGFYLIKENELVLGPFQGPLACTRIKKGRGVCGTAWQEEQTIIVSNVDEFPGHIACSSTSKSEIVIPIKKTGVVIGVLDIDSEQLSTFDNIDKRWLEKIVSIFN